MLIDQLSETTDLSTTTELSARRETIVTAMMRAAADHRWVGILGT